MRSRRAVSAVVLVLALSVTVACGSNPLQDLAAGVLGLQAAVIADGQSGNLPPVDEAKILKGLTQVETAVAALASGGPKAAIKDAWASALKDIPSADQTKYAVLIGAISGAVNAL